MAGTDLKYLEDDHIRENMEEGMCKSLY